MSCKTMLFSSFGFNSPILREKFAEVIPSDHTLKQKTCLIIPFAGFDSEKTGEREKQGLVTFGFCADRIEVATEQGNIRNATPDYIYVPGGDPFKLLQRLRENQPLLSAVRRCLETTDVVYIGVSAGAYLAADSLAYVTVVEDNNHLTDDMAALDLVPQNVLCHYDHYSYTTRKACEQRGGRTVVTVNDDQLLMFADGEWEYVGEYV